LSSPDVTVGVKRHSRDSQKRIGARPCIQVRILPFQPDLTGSFLLAPLRLLPMGITHYPFVKLRMRDISQWMFGLSSPAYARATIRYRA